MSEQSNKKFTFQYVVVSRHFVQADSAQEARMELNFQTIYESGFTLVEVAAIRDEVAEAQTGEPKRFMKTHLSQWIRVA